MNLWVRLSVDTFLFLLGKYLENGMAGSLSKGMFNLIRNCHRSSRVAVALCIPSSTGGEPTALHSHQHSDCLRPSSGEGNVSHCNFHLHLPHEEWGWVHQHGFLGVASVQIFSKLYSSYFSYYRVVRVFPLHIFWIQVFNHIYMIYMILHIFSPSLWLASSLSYWCLLKSKII